MSFRGTDDTIVGWQEDFQHVKEKIVKIVPDFCIIGALFSNYEPDMIVASSAEGIMEHDAYTWQIEGTEFVTCDDFQKKCKNYNEIFSNWIADVDVEQRKIFVEDFFEALKVRKSKNFQQVTDGGIENFEDVLLSFGRGKKTSKLVAWKLMKSFFMKLGKIDVLKLFYEKKMLQAQGMLLLGIIFVAFPTVASKLIGTIFTGVLGIVAVAISNNGSWIYMLTAGNYLVLYGFILAIKVILDIPEK